MDTLSSREQYIENLIEKVNASIEKNGGRDFLSSVILTGSLGRGEPTFAQNSQGIWELKSDVEIALVYPGISEKPKVKRLIEKVTSEIPENLNFMPISERRIRNVCNFNYSFRSSRYKTLFTYDLFCGSRTISGTNFLAGRNISKQEIDLYEAKRLTANRIGELVYCMNTVRNTDKEYLVKQWKGKVVLAIGSAWLLCEGKYVSSYRGQKAVLAAHSEKLDALAGEGFMEDYEKAFCFLRETGDGWDISEETLRGYVFRINCYFLKLGLCRPKVNSLSRSVKYRMKYLKTGMRYGFFGYENNILQALLDEYSCQIPSLKKTAEIWHHVLY